MGAMGFLAHGGERRGEEQEDRQGTELDIFVV